VEFTAIGAAGAGLTAGNGAPPLEPALWARDAEQDLDFLVAFSGTRANSRLRWFPMTRDPGFR
jgi:hypothetical protein